MTGSIAEPIVVPVPGRFAGAVAIVTGGASGIGAAVVAQLAAEGCDQVVVFDRQAQQDAAVTTALPSVSGEVVDVADAGAVADAFNRVLGRLGRIDILVHCAGIDDVESKDRLRQAASSGSPLDSFRHVSDGSWERIISVNLTGTFHVLRAALDAMIPRRSGVIVTIASSAAFDALEGYAPYAASKAGAKALAQAAAKEAARHGIRINTIAPGPVQTPMAGRAAPEVRAQLDLTSARGPATAQEIADSICFLASPAAANLVGAVLLSNGGRFTV